MSINQIIVGGYVTKEPTIKDVNGKKVAEFTVAHNHSKEKVSFINCAAWENLADVVAKFVDKGSKVVVQGSLSIDKYNDAYYTKVRVLNIELLSKSSNAQPSINNESQHPMNAGSDSSSSDDDLPF